MEKLKDGIQRVKDAVGGFPPTRKVILAALVIALLIGLALSPTLRICLALVLLVIAIIIIDPPFPPDILPPEELLQALCYSMYHVLRECAQQLSAVPPSYENQIIHNPLWHITDGDAVVCTFDIYKKSAETMSAADGLYIMEGVIQSRLEKHLFTVNPQLQGWYFNGGSEVRVQVVKIADEGATLAIHVLLAYDARTFNGGNAYIEWMRQADNYRRATTAVVSPSAHTPSIPFAYNKERWEDGILDPLRWPYERAPHAVVIGATGTGKTYLVKQIIHEALKNIPGSVVSVCDFKASDDFAFLLGREGYYTYTACAEGLQSFYNLFDARQSGADGSRTFCLLVFDEWASYLQTLDRKQSEGEMKKMATLLMLGRSFGIHVLVAQQRGDAQYFSTARDNFGLVVALGNLSPESRDMFFKGFKDDIDLTQTQGTGYVAINGGKPTAIKVRTVKMDRIEAAIARRFKAKPSDDAGGA